MLGDSKNADEGNKSIEVSSSVEKHDDFHQKNIENSKKAEKLFEEFLNKEEIPYCYISQGQYKLSEEFLKKNISRPDYIIFTDKNAYYIDVKFRTKKYFNEKNKYRFYLNQKEIIKLYNFQKKLNECVWISFINDLNNPQFFYSPISDIYEYYDNIRKLNKDFFESLIEIFLDGHEDVKDKLYVHIPENMLYSQLSIEKGFYNEPDNVFFEQEAKIHQLIWETEAYH